jgi:hypothetical protein
MAIAQSVNEAGEVIHAGGRPDSGQKPHQLSFTPLSPVKFAAT